MSYINGKEVLPEYLLKEIQKYFEGGTIYIPGSTKAERKQWGTRNNTRKKIENRNSEIKYKKKGGATIFELMEEYHLSYDSIKKIVYA